MRYVQALRGMPRQIEVDNCCEFISHVLNQWHTSKSQQWTSRDRENPRKIPLASRLSATIEISARLTLVSVVGDARDKIECWRLDCNEFRPHCSLGDLTPCKFWLAHLEAGDL